MGKSIFKFVVSSFKGACGYSVLYTWTDRKGTKKTDRHTRIFVGQLRIRMVILCRGTSLFPTCCCVGRGLSWFLFAVGSWRRCWGGGEGDGDRKAVWPCRVRCAWPGVFWAARGWSGSRAGAWKWRSAGVRLRAETPAVSMVNVACQTDSPGSTNYDLV